MSKNNNFCVNIKIRSHACSFSILSYIRKVLKKILTHSGLKFVTSVPIKRPTLNPILAPNALNTTTGRITTYATVISTQFSNGAFLTYTSIQIKIFETIKHERLGVSKLSYGMLIGGYFYFRIHSCGVFRKCSLVYNKNCI